MCLKRDLGTETECNVSDIIADAKNMIINILKIIIVPTYTGNNQTTKGN